MTSSMNDPNEQSQYDDAILDSTSIAPVDEQGNPIPVTIPIAIAPQISVVFTTRLGGVSQGDFASLNLGGRGGDDREAVRANRVGLAKSMNASLSLVGQVHSAEVADIDEIFVQNTAYGFDATGIDGERVEADAQVTSASGIALGMFAADCLPVLFADPESGIIGAAHCGRRGLQAGVIESTVAAMAAKGAQRERIIATLGPCICGECYEVGDEVADDFTNRFPLTKTQTRFGGAGIDIAEAARIDLAFAGITRVVDARPRVNAATQYLAQDEELMQLCRTDGEGPEELSERLEHINHSMCTLENPLWYSHRRAALSGKAHEGRMLALIVRQ